MNHSTSSAGMANAQATSGFNSEMIIYCVIGAMILILFALSLGRSPLLLFLSLICAAALVVFIVVRNNDKNETHEPVVLKDKYEFFVNTDEEPLAALGNGYLQNLASYGLFSKGNSVLSNRRVYFNGRTFYKGTGKKGWGSVRQSKIVEIDDVNGTEFTLYSPIGLLITGIVCCVISFLAIIVFAIMGMGDSFYSGNISSAGITYMSAVLLIGMINIITYLIKRKTFFSINYAGGSIGFPISWLGMETIRDFQRQLHLAKDKRKDEIRK